MSPRVWRWVVLLLAFGVVVTYWGTGDSQGAIVSLLVLIVYTIATHPGPYVYERRTWYCNREHPHATAAARDACEARR